MTDTDAPKNTESNKTSSFGAKLKKWGAVLVLSLVALFFLFRWGGTSTYEGTIQRVYEKTSDYRVEMLTEDGEVRVFSNREIRFPYLKFDTADLQGAFSNHQRSGDVVRVKVWGFRSAMFSWFPNVLRVDVIAAAEGRNKALAKAIAKEVLTVLTQEQALKPEATTTEGATDLLPTLEAAIEMHLSNPPKLNAPD